MKKYILVLVLSIILGGCTKQEMPIDEPVITDNPTEELRLTKEEQQEILKDYYTILKSNRDQQEVIEFIDDNIADLDTEIVDEIVLSLEEFLRISNSSMNELGSILTKYYNYSSDEVKSYITILDIEGQALFTDGEQINIDLEELLNRAITAENHIRIYQNSRTRTRVFDLYGAYVRGAIEGLGNQYIYATEGASTIKAEVLESYKKLIVNHNDSATASILEKYIENLELDNNDMNGANTLKFYEGLESFINDLNFQ